MSQVWFTADTHFGHANIIKHCQRPFLSPNEQRQAKEDPRGSWRVSRTTVEKHDEQLLETINSLVSTNDTLWIVGDFCWGELSSARYYRNRIECKDVRLVWGNHDHRSIEPVFSQTMEQGMISVKRQRIWLNHYPMRSWDRAFHGSWHLYGHVHARLQHEDDQVRHRLTRDVGVDACDYRPISFDQLVRYMSPRLTAFEKHKAKL
ncbi:MAG: metallophosphoesterase [Planctomycetota bacterium]